MGNSQRVGVQGETMSKNQNATITFDVETVENWVRMINYIHSSICFWFPGNQDKWPFNFVLDSLENVAKDINQFVSDSHITD